jgi:hypothetical protein
MKQTEQATVMVDLQMWHVERIWTQFRNNVLKQDVARVFNQARDDAYRKDQQQAPDPARIQVRVALTSDQATEVMVAFQPWIAYPADREVYTLVKNALEKE